SVTTAATADSLTHAHINGIQIYTVTLPGKMAEATRVVPRPMTPVPPEARSAPMGVIRNETTEIQSGGYGVDVKEFYRALTDMFTKSPAAGYTELSGGTSYTFSNQKSLDKAIQEIGQELGGQYILTFVPQNQAEGFHPIVVQVHADKKLGVRDVKARHGYWI